MLRKLRDSAVSATAAKALAFKLRGWCDMLRLDLDSTAKVLSLEALPKGEKETVRIEVRGYKLTQEHGKTMLTFDSLTVSREWLTVLAKTLLPDNRLELPEGTPVDLLKLLI